MEIHGNRILRLELGVVRDVLLVQLQLEDKQQEIIMEVELDILMLLRVEVMVQVLMEVLQCLEAMTPHQELTLEDIILVEEDMIHLEVM